MAMVDRIEKFSKVDVHNPALSQLHRLLPQRSESCVSAALGPEEPLPDGANPLAVTLLREGAYHLALLETIRSRARDVGASGIVCCHFDVRSSGYAYPNAAEIVHGLLDQGRFVISFSRLDIVEAGYLGIDIRDISVGDSIEILRALATEPMPLHIISVNSVMWAISAGLGIGNLGLHTIHDESIHQYLYSNTFVVSQHVYHRVPATRLFLAPRGSIRETANPAGGSLTSYDPAFVLDCFHGFLTAAR